LVGFDVLQQQINPIRRFNSNAQTPDSGITLWALLLNHNFYANNDDLVLDRTIDELSK